MQKKILVIIAHPDDESFGMGGTLAKYAREGAEIHVVCVTRGESGRGGRQQTQQRVNELHEASRILGIKKVELLGYEDGTLANNIYHKLATELGKKIQSFQPDIVLTYENLGVSGHIDHIVVSLVTTFVCRNYIDKLKLFYYCELAEIAKLRADYFVYFPPGYEKNEIDVVIDTEATWDIKVRAMYTHESQLPDVKMILSMKQNRPKREYFLEAFKTKKTRPFRSDFFTA